MIGLLLFGLQLLPEKPKKKRGRPPKNKSQD